MLTFLRWWCRHKHLMRVHESGIWSWRCVCGYQVPIVARTAEERTRALQLLGRA